MREMFMDVATTTVMAVFIAGFCILCRNVTVLAGNWLDKMREEAGNRNHEVSARLFETASQLLSGITYNAVAAMEQTRAKDIRERVKAGLEDRESLTILAGEVLCSIKNQLTPDVTRILEGYIGDLDGYMKDQMEAYLAGIKQLPATQLLSEIPTLPETQWIGRTTEDSRPHPESLSIFPEEGEELVHDRNP